MKNSKNEPAIIEIGNSLIRVKIMEKKFLKVKEIMTSTIIEWKGSLNEILNNTWKKSKTLTEIIRDAEIKSGRKIREVVVWADESIYGHHIEFAEITFDTPTRIEKNHIDYLQRKINMSLFSNTDDVEPTAIPYEYWVDGQTKISDPKGMIGKRLQVNCFVFAQRPQIINHIFTIFNLAGLEIVQLRGL